jgi:hypothetical protein
MAIAGGPKDTSVYGQGPYVFFVGTITGEGRNKGISGPFKIQLERRVWLEADRIAREPEDQW